MVKTSQGGIVNSMEDPSTDMKTSAPRRNHSMRHNLEKPMIVGAVGMEDGKTDRETVLRQAINMSIGPPETRRTGRRYPA
jgi:hypothetical protein